MKHVVVLVVAFALLAPQLCFAETAEPSPTVEIELTTEESRELARSAHRLVLAGLTLVTFGAVVNAATLAVALTDRDVGATFSLMAIGGAAWTVDTPLLIAADNRARRALGLERSTTATTCLFFYVFSIAVTAIHAAVGTRNNDTAITMPFITGSLSITTRILSLIVGASASRNSRRVLDEMRDEERKG